MSRRTVLCLAICLCLVVVPITSISVSAHGEDSETNQLSPNLSGTVEWEPGDEAVEITVRLTEPRASLDRFEFVLVNAENVEMDGFKETDAGGGSGTVYRWDGESENASVTFTVSTSDASGVVTDEYAFIPTPFVQALWVRGDESGYSSGVMMGSAAGDPVQVGNMSVVGSGVVGEGYLYVGEYTETTVENDYTEIRVVEIAGAESSIDYEEAATTFGRAQPYLRGEAPERAKVFVVPDPFVKSGETSRYTSEFWIHEDVSMDTPENLWLHEYIHVQQPTYSFGEKMEWYPEAVTTYQTVSLSVQFGYANESEAERYLKQVKYDEAVLTNSSTWPSDRVRYTKGAVAVKNLDSSIRESIDEKTLQDVLAEIHRTYSEGDRVRYETFQSILEQETSEEVAAEFHSELTRTGTIEMQSMEYEFPESSRVTPTPTPSPTPSDTDSTGLSSDGGWYVLAVVTIGAAIVVMILGWRRKQEFSS